MNRLQPLLRASQHATSSRVTLDALASLSARSFATSAAAQAGPRRKPVEVEVPPLRWEPESPEPYRNSNGLADRAPTHTLTIACSANNCILTFTDRIGPLVPNTFAGQAKKFKGAQRGSYEAAHQATVRMIEQIKKVAEEFRQRQEKNPEGEYWLKRRSSEGVQKRRSHWLVSSHQSFRTSGRGGVSMSKQLTIQTLSACTFVLRSRACSGTGATPPLPPSVDLRARTSVTSSLALRTAPRSRSEEPVRADLGGFRRLARLTIVCICSTTRNTDQATRT